MPATGRAHPISLRPELWEHRRDLGMPDVRVRRLRPEEASAAMS